MAAVSKLHNGRPNRGGYSGLITEHIKQACDKLFVHIAMLFTSMTVHEFVPDDFQMSIIIPIPKQKNANISDSDNDRGIAFGSIIDKSVDLILHL